MAGSTQVGRQGSTGSFANTIAPKSAEQAMLIAQDAMIDAINGIAAAVAASSDYATLKAGIAAAVPAALAKVALIR